MRLSEAIRLGSLAIQKPRAGDVRVCAVGMASEAIGCRESANPSSLNNYNVVRRQWPWVNERFSSEHLESYFGRIIHSFDENVMRGRTMTIEQLCDTVSGWERDLESKGINVEQAPMIAELTEPESPTQSIQEAPVTTVGK